MEMPKETLLQELFRYNEENNHKFECIVNVIKDGLDTITDSTQFNDEFMTALFKSNIDDKYKMNLVSLFVSSAGVYKNFMSYRSVVKNQEQLDIFTQLHLTVGYNAPFYQHCYNYFTRLDFIILAMNLSKEEFIDKYKQLDDKLALNKGINNVLYIIKPTPNKECGDYYKNENFNCIEFLHFLFNNDEELVYNFIKDIIQGQPRYNDYSQINCINKVYKERLDKDIENTVDSLCIDSTFKQIFDLHWKSQMIAYLYNKIKEKPSEYKNLLKVIDTESYIGEKELYKDLINICKICISKSTYGNSKNKYNPMIHLFNFDFNKVMDKLSDVFTEENLFKTI